MEQHVTQETRLTTMQYTSLVDPVILRPIVKRKARRSGKLQDSITTIFKTMRQTSKLLMQIRVRYRRDWRRERELRMRSTTNK